MTRVEISGVHRTEIRPVRAPNEDRPFYQLTFLGRDGKPVAAFDVFMDDDAPLEGDAPLHSAAVITRLQERIARGEKLEDLLEGEVNGG